MNLDGEVTMTFAEGPAVLGGIMIWAALGAWALGRWQGGLVAPESVRASPLPQQPGEEAASAPDRTAQTAPRASAPTPCQHAARDERRMALAAASCLGEMHEEITAYRRTEHILARLDEEMLQRDPLPADNVGSCRFIGLTGEPTCGVPDAARIACAGGVPCANAVPLPEPVRAAQPSAAVPGATRV
jgi:hypothetical protein